MAEVIAPEAAAPPVPATSTPSIEPTDIVKYLTDYLEQSFGISKDELETGGNFLEKNKYPETIQRCSRFINEPQAALYLVADEVMVKPVEGDQYDEAGMALMGNRNGHEDVHQY